MIDKLDIFVPASDCQLSMELVSALNDQLSFAGRSPFPGFSERRTFPRQDWEFNLHIALRDRMQFAFRIEITEAGRTNLRGTLLQVANLFGTDIDRASVKRLDLAVDVPDVPLIWFREHMTVARKRRYKEHECLKASDDLKEGLTFGKRPNVIRAYDKAMQLASVKSKTVSGVLTRVERQYGGRIIPQEFGEVGRLLDTVEDHRPFSSVRFLDRDATEDLTALDGHSGKNLLALTGYMALRRKLSATEFNRRLGPNRARIHLEYGPKLAPSLESNIDLDALFQESIQAQIGAPAISMYKQSA
jgi:hypothetical protein